MTTPRIRVHVLVLAAMLLLVAARSRATDPPVLIVPARPESVAISSPAAPLLIPGRGSPGDSLAKSRAQRAVDQYRIGLGLEQQGQLGAAVAAFSNAVQLDPNLPDAHFRLGRLYAGAGQHRRAVLALTDAVRVDPSDDEAVLALGLSLAQSGDARSAVERLAPLTRRRPRDAEAWKALGFAHGVNGDRLGAERALRRAIALAPRDARAWRDLGAVLAGTGRVDDARAAYEKSARLDPVDGTVWINRANLESHLGRHDRALEAFGEAARRDSASDLPWRGRIRELEALGRRDEAGRAWRQWLETRPQDRDLRMQAIEWFDAAGRSDIALEVAREGVRLAPRSGEAWLALGMALHASGDVRSALTEMRRAESLLRRDEQRDRLRGFIRSMRAAAPDSLRAVFAADSARYEAAGRDTSGVRE